jgi:monomeric sarcosine oxidase
MAQTFDAIVLGAGAMGSAAAYHLAKAGQRILLLEQFESDHQKGSSYGHSRIIRYAYDHPVYVTLMKAAYPMWQALENEIGEKLYYKTGGLDFGPADEPAVQNTAHSLRTAGIPHEELTPDEAHKRFPQFRFGDDWKIVYQADSGFLTASNCVRAHVSLAAKHGATVLANTPVTHISLHHDSVEVQTATETYTAGKLVITAGSWAQSVLAPLGLDLPLRPLRVQETYFRAEPVADFEPTRFPVFIAWVKRLYGDVFYGIANHNNTGVKVAIHGGQLVNHPSEINYTIDPATTDRVRVFTGPHIPGANHALASARVCIYTMTPDEHFVIDKHPEYPHVVFGGGCSGHSFKFGTLIGSILCDLALKGTTEHDISLFNVARFVTV